MPPLLKTSADLLSWLCFRHLSLLGCNLSPEKLQKNSQTVLAAVPSRNSLVLWSSGGKAFSRTAPSESASTTDLSSCFNLESESSPSIEETLFQPEFNYHNYYRNMLKALAAAEYLSDLRVVYIRLFENDNGALAETMAWVKEYGLNDYSPERWADFVRNKTIFTGAGPEQYEETLAKVGTVVGGFNATRKAGLPSVRHYSHQEKTSATEFRWASVAMSRGVGNPCEVDPLFKFYLRAKKEKEPESRHLYINLLRCAEDCGVSKDKELEIHREMALSRALHQLNNHHDNIYVINLPADNHFTTFSNRTGKYKEYFTGDDAWRKEAKHCLSHLIDAITENKHDFYFSEEIMSILFGSDCGHQIETLFREALFDLGLVDDVTVTELDELSLSERDKALTFSELPEGSSEREQDEALKAYHESKKKRRAARMAYKLPDNLSPRQYQALMAYFIKVTLTNHILRVLKPDSINFTCKDGIDRGGIASLLYNFMLSYKNSQVMSEDEFYQGLHAACLHSKGRLINGHRNLLWNVLDIWVRTKPQQDKKVAIPEQDKKVAIPDWLIYWLIYWLQSNRPENVPAQDYSAGYLEETTVIFDPIGLAKSLKDLASSSRLSYSGSP